MLARSLRELMPAWNVSSEGAADPNTPGVKMTVIGRRRYPVRERLAAAESGKQVASSNPRRFDENRIHWADAL
jgi:polyphosphate kinase